MTNGAGVQPAQLVLADFGSAVDEHAASALYGEEGPTRGESTLDYAPPEVLLSSEPYARGLPTVCVRVGVCMCVVKCLCLLSLTRALAQSYDIWSAAVVFLEVCARALSSARARSVPLVTLTLARRRTYRCSWARRTRLTSARASARWLRPRWLARGTGFVSRVVVPPADRAAIE